MHFNELHEMEEVEAIQSGLQRYEQRMRQATELRQKKQQELKTNMQNLTSKVNEKLDFKVLKIENDYNSEFEKNVLKRQKIEEKKKKKAEENNANHEFDMERK